jgi:hypothetical protein
MEHDTGITAETVVRARRRCRHATSADAAQSITAPGTRQIREAARKRFGQACDAGIWKRLASVLLEPANPFDAKAARRARRETVVLGALLAFAAAMAMLFNIPQLRGDR